MPKNAAFVQIEANEAPESVKDRLSFLRGQNVLLIWPEEGTVLTRKLDLVLIQREAMRRAIRLALVTHDPQVIKHARELNISSFETIGASERGRWKRGRGKVFANRAHKPKDAPEPGELMDVASRVRRPGVLPVPMLVRVLILVVLMGAVGVVAVVVIPGATITLMLAEEEVTIEAQIIASTEAEVVDVAAGVIPARVQPIQVRQSDTRETSGVIDQPDLLASGSVLFSNVTGQRIDIPAGTVVNTTTGEIVRFRTTVDATLPSGVDEQIEVAIEALPESGGDVGNVGIGVINAVAADWADQVVITNLTPTTGGATRSLPAVTQQDLDRLEAAVRQKIQAQALTELQTFLGPSEEVIPATIRITDESERPDWVIFSAGVGDAVDTVSLDMQAVVEAVIVNTQHGQRIAFTQMSELVPRGRVLEAGSIQYTVGPVTNISEDNRVTFSIIGNGQVRGQASVGILQERLVGLSPDAAQDFLVNTVDLMPGTQPDIVISPDWFDRLPLLPVRITIRLVNSG